MMKFSLIALAIIGIVYLVGINGDFQFDDYESVHHYTQNRQITPTWGGIMKNDTIGRNRRRIIPNMLLTANYLMFGYNTMGYHVTSILLHLAVCAVLFRICMISGGGIWGSFLAVMLYGLHPVNVSTVSYIAQRSVIMATLFCALSWLFYQRGRQTKSVESLYWSLYFWGAACLCKENAYIFPAAIILYEFAVVRKIKDPRFWLGLAVAVEVFAVAGMLAFRQKLFWSNYWVFEFNSWERLCSEGLVMIRYLYMVMCPHIDNLAIAHGARIISHPLYIVLFLTILLGVWTWRKKDKSLTGFALAAFLVMMLPESSFVPLELMFEHRLYLPLMFFVPVLARVRWQPHLAAVIIAYLAIVNMLYQNMWASELRAWRHCAELYPDDARANVGYASQLIKARRELEAAAFYKRTLDCPARHAGYWHKKARHDLRVFLPLIVEDLNELIQESNNDRFTR